ncbi:MAG: HEPN domain-containing protein [Pirellulaceae bacterium]
MSEAKASFEFGIKDSEDLLAHFDAINCQPPPDNAEVLKRASLVMALTAWETYVEDRVEEALAKKIAVVAGSYAGNFILRKLATDLKTFHNPDSNKTRRLFLEYLEVDVTEGWTWTNMDSAKAKKTLDAWLKKRGDAVHRARKPSNGSASKHLVKREELVKVIRFIKELVAATEKHLAACL